MLDILMIMAPSLGIPGITAMLFLRDINKIASTDDRLVPRAYGSAVTARSRTQKALNEERPPKRRAAFSK